MAHSTEPPLSFSCDCGGLRGQITGPGVTAGTHCACFCHDCRAAQLYFNQSDPVPGPVDVFQMSPEEVQFTEGAENLALMQLSPNGMFRWYAKCCNAPLATTPGTPKFPFASFIVKRIADTDRLGPVTTRGFVPRPNGKQKHEKLQYAAFGLSKRLLKSWLTGSWRQTPFFNLATGEPVVAPHVITLEERAGLYD